jgi:DNA-binding MarR family transcriptional regulator
VDAERARAGSRDKGRAAARADSPEVTEIASRLRLAVARTARRLRQEAGGELSPSQNAALATIANHGPLTPSELAAIERIQRPTVTRILSRLEESGLVQRTPDPRDGRACLVSATPDGTRLLRRLRGRKNAYLAKRMRDLSPGELAALENAVASLERILEDERG